MRIFIFFGAFADSLGQAAQSFLPAAIYPVKRARDFNQILKRLAVLATGVAVFNFTASRAIMLHCASSFTSDAGILSCIQNTSIWTAICLALHPIIIGISGTVIATRQFRNLVKVYAVTVAAHFAVLRKAASFAQVWQALVIFQLVRLFNYGFWSVVTPERKRRDNQLTTASP